MGRSICLALGLLATTATVTTVAEAQPASDPACRAVNDRGNFWCEVIEPNGDQVRTLVKKARDVMKEPDNALTSDSTWAVEQRARFFRDAFHLLRHARRLSPDNVEVLAELGRAADEIGRTRDALDALEACVRIAGPEKAGAEVTGRLGAIYLRQNKADAALRWLRLAQGPLTKESAAPLIYLANALAARGETGAAIDTLHNVLPAGALGNAQEGPVSLVAFSLAVIYDRDEQRSAAFDVLDRLQSSMQQQYASYVHGEIAKLRFVPAIDQHYYQALLYESLGHYTEARAEWAIYAAAGDSPWRGRALDHVAAIDAQRRRSPASRGRPSSAPHPTRHPRIPRP